MRTPLNFRVTALALLAIALPIRVGAQVVGRVDFTAHVTPTDGRPEPVRQLTFYLSSKSLSDIRSEAERRDPAPELAAFVDSLKVSPELKSWMKMHHTVELSGGDFTKSLTPDDVVDIPELFNAYMSRNSGFANIGFPKPKFKEKDKAKAPEKYAQEKADYLAAIKKFIAATPESVKGIDSDLDDINPYDKWEQNLIERNRRIEKTTLDLAERNYVVKQTDTDLDGRGSFSDVPPGEYWIGTLATQAIAGDARLRWDMRISVRAGEIARADLTNLNAAEPVESASRSKP